MNRLQRMIVVLVWSIVVPTLLSGCLPDADQLRDKKFKVILADDLATLIAGVDSVGLADACYYELVEYTTGYEGKFSARAVVDFYFLKKVGVKVVRKYRYHTVLGQWDRYYNKYEFIPTQQHDDNEVPKNR
jgi:hypothetical protein